ncbi:hypothetical protein [Vibrio metschnikovii]|uniref:hypothetical protein n=1 Tax=Vibrio metschnikovii TaxID=28172 RepID=UPI002FCC3951
MQELQTITDQYAHVHFVPVVEKAPAEWSGKIGNVLQAVLADFDSLAEVAIYRASTVLV